MSSREGQPLTTRQRRSNIYSIESHWQHSPIAVSKTVISEQKIVVGASESTQEQTEADADTDIDLGFTNTELKNLFETQESEEEQGGDQ